MNKGCFTETSVQGTGWGKEPESELVSAVEPKQDLKHGQEPHQNRNKIYNKSGARIDWRNRIRHLISEPEQAPGSDVEPNLVPASHWWREEKLQIVLFVDVMSQNLCLLLKNIPHVLCLTLKEPWLLRTGSVLRWMKPSQISFCSQSRSYGRNLSEWVPDQELVLVLVLVLVQLVFEL